MHVLPKFCQWGFLSNCLAFIGTWQKASSNWDNQVNHIYINRDCRYNLHIYELGLFWHVNFDIIDLPIVIIKFVIFQGNYVLESDILLELQKEKYDTILALSLTKWIHLNWGDSGLKRVFKRIYRQLRPGGRLVLEPQSWSSYKKKKKLTVPV